MGLLLYSSRSSLFLLTIYGARWEEGMCSDAVHDDEVDVDEGQWYNDDVG